MAKKDKRGKRDKDEVTKDDGATTRTADAPRAEGVELENAPPTLNPNLGPGKARPGTEPGVDGTVGELHAFDQAALTAQVGDLTSLKQGLEVGPNAGPGIEIMKKLAGEHGLKEGGIDVPVHQSKDGGPPTGKDWSLYGGTDGGWGVKDIPLVGPKIDEAIKKLGGSGGSGGGGGTGGGGGSGIVDPLKAKGTGSPQLAKDLAAKEQAEIAAKAAEKERVAKVKEANAAKEKAAKEQKAKDEQAAKDAADKKAADEKEAARKAAEEKEKTGGMVDPDAGDGSTAPAWVTAASGGQPVVETGDWVSRPVNPDVGGGNGGNGTLDPSKVRIGGIDPGVVDKNPDYDEGAPIGTAELRGRPDDQLTNFGNPKDNLNPPLPPGGAPPSGGGGGAGPDKGRGAPVEVIEAAPNQVAPPAPAPAAVQEAPVPAPELNLPNDFGDQPAVTTGEPGPPTVPEDDGRD